MVKLDRNKHSTYRSLDTETIKALTNELDTIFDNLFDELMNAGRKQKEVSDKIEKNIEELEEKGFDKSTIKYYQSIYDSILNFNGTNQAYITNPT